MTTSTFTTDSIGEAAFILARGYPVIALEPHPDRPGVRLFRFDGAAASEVSHYHHGTAVPAKHFYEAVLDVRRALFPRALRSGSRH